MDNLLRETIDFLQENAKRPEDVLWVGNEDGTLVISWEEFASFADLEYDNSSNRGTLVAMDLVVVGENWWLERHDYDGAEWWEFKTLPRKAEKATAFANVLGIYVLLENINP